MIGSPKTLLRPMPGAGFRSRGRAEILIPRDGPSNWYVPTTGEHFIALGLNVPNFLWGCQEEAGSLQTILGPTLPLAATGAPLYRQSVTGWTRGFVGSTYDVQGGFTTTSALLDLANGESCVMVGLASFTTPAATTRNLLVIASATADEVSFASTGGLIRARNSAGSVNGVVSHTGINTVHQLLWYRNAATDVSSVVTDLETIALTHNETARTGQIKGIAPDPSSSVPSARVGWVAFYKGSNAEFDPVAYLARLRGP